MSASAYLALVPPATAEVSCGEQTHQLHWSAGELTAPDHSDPEGERALAALGGDTSRCIEVLDAWHRHSSELRTLVLTSRGPNDPLMFDAAGPGRRSRGRVRPGRSTATLVSSANHGGGSVSFTQTVTSTRRAEHTSPDPVQDYLTLFSLGRGLDHRLAATVAAHWSERIDSGTATAEHTPALHAALAGRACAAVRTWLSDPAADADVTMIGPDETPTATLNGSHWTLHLPFLWLSLVWAPSLAVTAGRLVLDTRRSDGALVLTTMRPHDPQTSDITISIAP